MADSDAGAPEPADLLRAEMNAVREPRPLRHPAGLLQQIDRPHAIHLQAEALLVLRLAQMGVQLAVVALGEARGLAHQPLVDRERRTGRERDRGFARPGPGSWNSFSTRSLSARMASSSCTTRIGRQAAMPSDRRFIEPRVTVMRIPSARASSTSMSTASSRPRREEIMMIGRRRAARQHQFGQGETHGDAQLMRLQPRPDRIERHQPGKQFLVDRRRVGACQRLIEMMMGVDEAGQHDMARGVENRRRPAPPARAPARPSPRCARPRRRGRARRLRRKWRAGP